MNGIGLELYKRERIKEQSRHLRYEDAVGSTGQSQGIYIQFLIAVINYIASINSWHGDPEDLTKVIFIDNPLRRRQGYLYLGAHLRYAAGQSGAADRAHPRSDTGHDR